jgi:hypothetical protein
MFVGIARRYYKDSINASLTNARLTRERLAVHLEISNALHIKAQAMSLDMHLPPEGSICSGVCIATSRHTRAFYASMACLFERSACRGALHRFLAVSAACKMKYVAQTALRFALCSIGAPR